MPRSPHHSINRDSPPDSYLTPDFFRVTVANFFFFLSFASFFLLPLHIRALGGTDREVGFVMGTFGLSGLMSVFVIGDLLDRFGRRLFLRGGIAGMGLAAAGFLFVDRIGPAIFALRALQGLAFSAGFNAASTLAAEFAPASRRASALGVFGVSTLATHALAPTIGEQIVAVAGFPALFAVAAGFAGIGLAIVWSLPVAPFHAGTVSTPLRANRELRASVATSALCGLAFGSVITFTPTFTRDAELGPVSTFFLSYTASAILVRLSAGSLGDSLGRRRVLIPSLVLLAGSIAGIALVHSAVALAVAGLSFGLAQGIVYPTLNAFSVDQAGDGQLGRVQGLYNGSFNLGTTAGSLALGSVVHAFGHRMMFLCAAAAAALGLVIFSAGTGSPRARRRTA